MNTYLNTEQLLERINKQDREQRIKYLAGLPIAPVDPRNTSMPTIIIAIGLVMLVSFIITAELYITGWTESKIIAVLPIIVLFPVFTVLGIIQEIRVKRYFKWLRDRDQEFEDLKNHYELSAWESQTYE